MATTTPTVRGEILTWSVAGTDRTIRVGTPAWFAWLEGADGFAYHGPEGKFTARKESRQRGGWYWKAYRKLSGKLHRVYLGKTSELTAPRLAEAATALAAFAGPDPEGVRQAPKRNPRGTVSAMSLPGAPQSAAGERPVRLVPSLRPASATPRRARAPMTGWPSGTITFLFTDIVDSTQLWDRYPREMPQILVHHDTLIQSAIAAHRGVVFKTLGDAVCAAFMRAPDALAAAQAIWRAIQAENWIALGLPPERPLQIRMALHTGAAELRNGDYFGSPLNQVARILAVGRSGQILLSQATRELLLDALPDNITLHDLGSYQLKGLHGSPFSHSERLFQLANPDVPAEATLSIEPTRSDAARDVRPLLTTKISAPSRAGLMPRPRLIERLSRLVQRQLTLIVAPPGFGKTTLLADWLAQISDCGLQTADRPTLSSAISTLQSPRVAWLTLDEADNDPVRFWTYLVAALEQHWPGIGAEAAPLLRAPQPAPIETVLTVLINAIAAMPSALVLVLDDYHVISALPIQRAIAMLITYLPSNFHMVIASRADIPLPLARLRARGEVAEIRADDLRCTPDEAAAYLRTLLGRDLARDAIAILLERTEGWMAGLQLAALSLQGETDAAGLIAAIRGDNRYIWDYLVDEVLNRQPPAIRHFLLVTSLLDRMCADLCDAVLDVRDANRDSRGALRGSSLKSQASQAMLETLESSNLFVVPLDGERRWYRYHRLFADVLRLRVRQLHPKLVAPIHQRAAAWYRDNGLTGDAIQHALAGQDWAEAAAVIEESAEALLLHGEVTTLLNWIRRLPPDVLQRRPRLCLFNAGVLLTIGQLDEADEYVRVAEHADEARQSTEGSSPTSGLRPGELDTIRAMIAGSRGDLSLAIAAARSALTQLPQERNMFRLAATMLLGAYGWMRGENSETLEFIESQFALDPSAGNELLHAWTNSLLIYVQFSEGKLRQAAQTCWRLLDLNADRSVPLLTAGAAAASLSEISYEWNDLEAAVRFARDGIAHSQRFGSPEQEAFCLAALALTLQAQSDAAGAGAAVEQALKLVQRQPIERAIVATYQVRLWLAQNDLEHALAWARACPSRTADTIAYLRAREQLTQARVYLAQGATMLAQACALLVPLLHEAETHEQFGRAIEAWALLALAHAAQRDTARAFDCLTHALRHAAPEGYIRLFTDLGTPMRVLLAELRLQMVQGGPNESGAHTASLLAYVDKLLTAFGRNVESSDTSLVDARSASLVKHAAAMLVERLSARELEVLRLIAAGQSNQAIAGTLIIAESTVKMHLKNIYGKLGAHSRTQAIARARALDLL